ncbi:MAG: putative subtilase-type serine protease precursor [Gemmataceae bacterium]|nr:putative subtilase-type serine protease precursor [Gemmataceae bacterium]
MRRLVFGLAAVAAGALATAAVAQQAPPPGLPTPRINHAFPAGAKLGTAVEVTAAGFDLDEPTGLLFSHPGIKGEYVAPKPPEPDPKKKDQPPPKAVPIPPTGPHKFKVTVDAAVPPGTYDVRFVGKWGVSNPRAFVVGELPEVAEKEPNNDVPEAQKIEIGTTVNGVIANPTDVDYTVFAGKRGQRVVISCLASGIDSRAHPMIEVFDTAGRKLALSRAYREADAVTDLVLPEDGDYYVRLFEFTYQTGTPDHVYRLTISTAPWVDAVFPPAVEFGKPAQVTLYGRNLPNGQPTGFTVDGRPLEKVTVSVTPPADPLAAQQLAVRDLIEPVTALQDGFEYRLKGPGGLSNPVPIYFAREKLVLKKNEGGTKAETAEPLAIPAEVAGMLHRRGDRDWYSFDAKKGDGLTIELTAERNLSPADFFFNIYAPADAKAMTKIRDLSGEIDDDADPQTMSLHPTEFYTRTSDPPAYKFTAPADGKYLVAVGSHHSSFLFGPQTAYRLRVGPARPDFRAVVKPYAKSFQTGSAGRQDGTEAYEVFVHRTDGFIGAVTVTAEGLPAGVTAKPTVIGPAARWGVLVLDVGPAAAAFTGAITVKATSAADGKPLVREARPASVTWGSQPGQNVPVVSRLTQTLVLAVRPEKGFFKVAADPANAVVKPATGKEEKVAGPIVVRQGDKVTLPVKTTWAGADKPNVTLVAELMSQNPQTTPITVQVATQPTKDKPDVTVTMDVKPTALPGVYGVVIRGDSQVAFVRDPMGKQKANVPATAFAAPVEITVIPTSLAKLTPGQIPNGVVKIGMTGELVVKIERQYDFAGEYKVKFVPPTGVVGVTADEMTVPAGKDEAKLVFKAAADAKPGAVSNGTIVVTAVYGGKYTVTHEAKVNFSVAK